MTTKKRCETQLLSNNEKGGAEMEKIEEVRVAFKEECPICKKDIIGSTENQVKYNLSIHMNAKHGTAITPSSEIENAKQ